ncbi:MAG: hypothetical protein ACREI8_03335 [Myxococcota bacterium]
MVGEFEGDEPPFPYTVAWRPGDYGARLVEVTLETLGGSFDRGSNAGPTGCPNHVGVTEDPACDDGFDNDRDVGIDADGGRSGVADGQCDAPTRPLEHADTGLGCGLSPELALLLPFLGTLRRRAR